MKDIITPFKVGLVVVVGVIAFIWMFGRIEEGIGDDAAGYRVYAIFDDAGGLTEKSRITIAGISVGELDRIELVGDKAKIWIRVNTPLRTDARISKKQTSLLGEYALQLSPGYTGEPLGDGDQIRNIQVDVTPADLLVDLKQITANVTDITDSLKRVVGGQGGEQKLIDILENINKTVAEVQVAVAQNAPKVDIVVDNVVKVTAEARALTAEFRRSANRILDDAEAVTQTVRSIIGDNTEVVQEGFDGVKGAARRLQDALDKLDGTLDRARSIATKIDEGEGTIGRLVNDDRLINSVNELVDESGSFVKQITRLQTIVAMRADYYINQGSMRTAVDLKLQPRPDKYYMLSLVDDPRGNTTVTERVTLTSESDEDPVIREQQTVTEDRFRLSLQFAKRLYMFTGRIGIIENSGGVGLDLHLAGDALKLSADLFSFDANVWPRLRIDLLYTFFTHLYIAAGVDEVLNEELTDVFFGVGLTFNDQDLKAILATAPAPSL